MAHRIASRSRGLKSGRGVNSGRIVRRRLKAALTCRQETDFIASYLAAELRGPTLEAFEHHLKLCPDCVAFLQTYKATIALTREFLSGNASHGPSMSLRLRKPRTKR
jgi:hypothetical protein